MEIKTLKKILDFLEEEDDKIPFDKGDLRWMLFFNEPISDDDLNIKGNLDLERLNITSLPEGLYVGGDLNLGYCKNLTLLLEGLYVGGDLFVDHCYNLKSLPKGLKVGGDLYISNSSIVNYSEEELRKMIEPGYIKGEVLDYEDPWNEM